MDPIKKKAALEFLDNEINSLSKKNTKESSVNSLAAKALEGLTSGKKGEEKESGWGDEDSLKSAELDFNDLEISFD